MRRLVIIVTAIIVVFGIGYWAYHSYASTQSENDAGQEAQAAVDDLTNVIWASGELQPRVWAGLTTATTGVVSQIHVDEGERVQAGDLLLELENGVMKSEVEVATAQAAEAQAALDKLLAGSTAAEIAGAEAALSAAEAGVAQAAGHMTETEVAVNLAETKANIAERQYAELASHPTAAELDAALAEEGIAEAAVNQAQAAYNLVRGDPNIVARPEALALQEATASLEAAKAKARMISEGATDEELAVAQGQIDAARAEIEAASSRTAGAEAAVQAAIAERASAEADLNKMLDGPTEEEIAMARAHVASALAALSAAQATLEQSVVRAPMDGQVGTINVRVGEMATPDNFALLIGQTEDMHVETTDLRETDVVHLSVGMPVEVTFDALADAVFSGTVAKIAPVSNTEQGSTNYTVEIDVEDLDERLRWGMTAFVNIDTSE
jgi:multidrug resistance efflux pump